MSTPENKEDDAAFKKLFLTTIFSVIAIFWVFWVSMNLREQNRQRIVQVDMAGLIREFVDAEARKNSDPEATKESIQRFLSVTEDVVADLGREGRVILVSEAVLSKNTPDATDAVRAIIARKTLGPDTEQKR